MTRKVRSKALLRRHTPSVPFALCLSFQSSMRSLEEEDQSLEDRSSCASVHSSKVSPNTVSPEFSCRVSESDALHSRNVYCRAFHSRLRDPYMHCLWLFLDWRTWLSQRTPSPYLSLQRFLLCRPNRCGRNHVRNEQYPKQLGLANSLSPPAGAISPPALTPFPL